MTSYFVDQKVVLWKRIRVSLPDDITEEQMLKYLHECDYPEEIEEMSDKIYIDSEYLVDSEEECYQDDPTIEVYNHHYDLIDTW